MKRSVLLACLLSPSSAIPAEVTLKVFYCWYEEQCVSGDNAVSMERTDFARLATMVLTGSKGNFIGFIDDSVTTLQFYVDGPDMVHVEIPVASRRGSLGSEINLRRAQDIIASLSPPLSKYELELDLKFQEWSQESTTAPVPPSSAETTPSAQEHKPYYVSPDNTLLRCKSAEFLECMSLSESQCVSFIEKGFAEGNAEVEAEAASKSEKETSSDSFRTRAVGVIAGLLHLASDRKFIECI